MEIKTITIDVLKADEGKILTDGSVYGKTIYLAANRTADEFHEITEGEYNEIKGEEADERI